MFEDRMKTSAIPERVYSLCQAVKSRSMLESDLRELLEPSGLGGTTKYFGTVRDAAKQLGLISIKEGNISLAVESKYVYSYDSMREYIICNIDAISDGLFFKVSQEYISMNEQVFRYKGVSEAALVEHMSKMIGFPVYEDDMRAWRFWATYLGLGNLHDMLLLPNMYGLYHRAQKSFRCLKKRHHDTDLWRIVPFFCLLFLFLYLLRCRLMFFIPWLIRNIFCLHLFLETDDKFFPSIMFQIAESLHNFLNGYFLKN